MAFARLSLSIFAMGLVAGCGAPDHFLIANNASSAPLFVKITHPEDQTGIYVFRVGPHEIKWLPGWDGNEEPPNVDILDADCGMLARGAVDDDALILTPVSQRIDVSEITIAVLTRFAAPSGSGGEVVFNCGGSPLLYGNGTMSDGVPR